jgi:hypothetical protein
MAHRRSIAKQFPDGLKEYSFVRDELAETMHKNFGVFRREDQMIEQGDRMFGSSGG